jgi:enoyl-CoA hydratase/carnithine racemase
MDYEQIRYDVDGPILTITLHRPDKLNAFTIRMMHEMIDAFDRVDVRRVIVGPLTIPGPETGGQVISCRQRWAAR